MARQIIFAIAVLAAVALVLLLPRAFEEARDERLSPIRLNDAVEPQPWPPVVREPRKQRERRKLREPRRPRPTATPPEPSARTPAATPPPVVSRPSPRPPVTPKPAPTAPPPVGDDDGDDDDDNDGGDG